MPFSRFILIITLPPFLIILTGCSKHQSTNLDEALVLYRENKLEQALPLFENLVDQDRNNPDKCV